MKDRDLIGFDSAAIYVFQFNLWKMKKFGMSENFILMDDDYFINSPLNKSDFFYEKDNQIYPLMITNDYYLMNEKKIRKEHNQNKLMINGKNTHSEEVFLYRQLSSLKFMYEIFGSDKSRSKKPLIEASFSHNAIPLKLSDIKEIYDLIIDKYKYVKETLYSIERNAHSLHFQTLILSYILNKYHRKVHGLSCAYIDIYNYHLFEARYNITEKLFVINTSDKEYEENIFLLEKIFLDNKFPVATKYELEKGESNEDEEDSKNIINSKNKINVNIKKNIVEKKKKNSSYYYVEYLWILMLIIIIIIMLGYVIKKLRNYMGYSKIQ